MPDAAECLNVVSPDSSDAVSTGGNHSCGWNAGGVPTSPPAPGAESSTNLSPLLVFAFCLAFWGAVAFALVELT